MGRPQSPHNAVVALGKARDLQGTAVADTYTYRQTLTLAYVSVKTWCEPWPSSSCPNRRRPRATIARCSRTGDARRADSNRCEQAAAMAETTLATGTCNSAEPERPNLAEWLYDKAAEELDQKHPWYRLPKLLGLAELIAIRCGGRICMTPRGASHESRATAAIRPLIAHRTLPGPQLERPRPSRDGHGRHAVRAQRPARGHVAGSRPDPGAQPQCHLELAGK